MPLKGTVLIVGPDIIIGPNIITVRGPQVNLNNIIINGIDVDSVLGKRVKDFFFFLKRVKD